MKRLLTLFTLIALSLITYHLSLKSSFSQDFDYNRSYNDFVYSYNLYRSAHLDYVAAKAEYHTYGTLTAKTKAIQAARKLLHQRAEALKTYLTALRMKLHEETGITTYKQNLYFIKLDDEITWLTQHQSNLTTPSTVEDLIDESKKLEGRYLQIQIVSYQTLGAILEGREDSLREEVEEIIEATGQKIEEIRVSGEDTTFLERWLIEAQQKVNLSEEKQSQAAYVLATIDPRSREVSKSFDKARYLLEESNQYLKEAVTYLKEIIREIKRA
jgi:hypothetical protein